MATTFKVPSSPSKSIFEIDNFLGVDLTNSGTNIEETRSPNATNMVRYVPGKVRKRTGYQTETVFGNGLNTNLAIGADDKEYTVEITSEESTALYNLFLPKKSDEDATCYYEFEYKSEGDFWLPYIGWIDASPNDFTYINKKVNAPSGTGMSTIKIKSGSGFPTQNVTFRKFSFMLRQDENYKWQKAPKQFVYRESNDPILGFHGIKQGTFDGNRVVNVNRALSTSSTYKTLSVVTTPSTVIANLGEHPYPGRKFYVEFDYEISGSSIEFNFFGSVVPLSATTTETHFSYEANVNTSSTWESLKCWSSSGTSTLKIKNVSIMYDKNDKYVWSKAPEDSGEKFHLEDTYLIGSTNYALFEESNKSYDAENSSTTITLEIGDSTSPHDFVHIGFDAYVSMRKPLNTVTIEVLNNTSTVLWKYTQSGALDTKHFELYLGTASTSCYAKQIRVTMTYPSTAYELPCWVTIKNLKLNSVTARTSYIVSSKYAIYHVGSDFYLKENNNENFIKILTGANKEKSSSWQLSDRLIILDGKSVYSYQVGDDAARRIDDENGYIPTVTISKSPSGGGKSYEPLNMLQSGFYETFYVSSDNASATLFFLSFDDLDASEVKVWVLSSSGTWVEKTEGTHYHVNRGSGQIAFITAPGASPLTGEDNVKIFAHKTFPGYKDRVSNCTIGTLFGVNGASDRLFLSGNPEYPNYDWFSEQYDPTYFPDTGYSVLGLSSSAIVGYAVVNNYLATFKDEYEPSQSVFIREGDLVTDEVTKIANPVFKLINTLQGNGVIAPYSFGYLQTEPLFLTRSGIFSITAQDITGEKYAQNRSFYLNGALTEEPNLEDAYSVVFNDMYILAINSKLYILDGLQATRTDKSEPYATRQYVGFYCTNVPVLSMWTDEQALWFGTENGKVCRFETDIDNLESYNDNGEPIYCCWETPDLDGKLFYKNKSFRYLAIRMMAALKTSAKLWSMARGSWSFIKEDTTSGMFFDFENIDFEAFTFSTDRSDKVAHSKIRVKKVDKARFKIENERLNEPFGLLNLALEYVESGNYKG